MFLVCLSCILVANLFRMSLLTGAPCGSPFAVTLDSVRLLVLLSDCLFGRSCLFVFLCL